MEWFKHGDKTSVQQTLEVSGSLGRLILNILESRLEEIQGKAVNPDNYDTPSWAYKQAHYNGEANQLRKLIDLLSIYKD